MQKLAEDIGVSKQLIGQIEKGKRAISNDVLSKLADYFGLNKQISADYRAFLMKETMSELEILKVKKAKIEKESEVIEIEETDPYTGDTYMRQYNTLDVDGYIAMDYGIRKKGFIDKIEKRLESIVDKTIEKEGEFMSYEYALSYATEKIEFYEKIIDLDAKADPYIFESIIRAISIATKGGLDSNSFINKLTKIIKKEIDKKEKEREDDIKLLQELGCDLSND